MSTCVHCKSNFFSDEKRLTVEGILQKAITRETHKGEAGRVRAQVEAAIFETLGLPRDIDKQLYQIVATAVQGVQEIPIDRSDRPAVEKMRDVLELRAKWIQGAVEQIKTVIALQ